MTKTEVIIIGAGPAGLAIGAHLCRAGVDFELLEKSKHVGNSWRAHYDRLHLHTVKELSHLPFLPFPEDYPRFVPRQLLIDYFEKYREHWNLNPRFEQEVTLLEKDGENWVVSTRGGHRYSAPHVVVAMGVNHSPNRPVFPGEDTFKGTITHSCTYKNALPYAGKKVLVVGMGNTGAEIALDLAEQGAEPTIAVRDAINIVPREFKGRPTQLTALTLAKLPNWLGDWIGVRLRAFTMGDLRKYGIKFPKMPPARQLREMGKTPVVDIGTADMIRAGKIKVVHAGIDRFYKEGVQFSDGRQIDFDSVILATGYKAKLEQLIPGVEQILDQYGWPEFIIGKGEWNGLYFIGYDNYTAGGILGVINRDAARICETIIAGRPQKEPATRK